MTRDEMRSRLCVALDAIERMRINEPEHEEALGRAALQVYRAMDAMFPEPPPNTVPVRIAVGVNRNGFWSAFGQLDLDDGLCMAAAHDPPGEMECWVFVTASVPLPKPVEEVAGEVE